MFGKVRKKGQVRLGRERFGIMGSFECHATELELYSIGSGKRWESQRVIRWVEGHEELSRLFLKLREDVTDILQVDSSPFRI